MGIATILIGIGSILAASAAAWAAYYGPKHSVKLAHEMGQQENKRIEAGKLFRLIQANCLDLRQVFRECYEIKRFELLIGKIEKSMPQTTEAAKAILDERKDILTKSRQAQQSNHVVQVALNADMLLLDLLFGKRSAECYGAVRKVAEMGDVFSKDDLPPYEECLAEMNARIECVSEAIKPLYNSLRRPDSFGDDV